MNKNLVQQLRNDKLINKYFKNKKIEALVTKQASAFNKKIYKINLIDISKLNKFNATMEKELSLVLGKNVSIENTNNQLRLIVVENSVSETSETLRVNIGKTLENDDLDLSLKQEVHLLVAGSTGSGKSVFLNNLIQDLVLQYNDELEFAFIDLKKVELARYKNLNTCVGFSDDITTALELLDNVIDLMNNRYAKYQEHNVLDIDSYNKISDDKDRYFVLVIDELAELMLQAKKDVTSKLQRILQLGRAGGIHVIACTQRPSSDVVAGTLKVNFTSRICFSVQNRHDSTTILNTKGAESLAKNGDGLMLKNGSTQLIHFQAKPPCDDDNLRDYMRSDNNTITSTNVKLIVVFTIIAIVLAIPIAIILFILMFKALRVLYTFFLGCIGLTIIFVFIVSIAILRR